MTLNLALPTANAGYQDVNLVGVVDIGSNSVRLVIFEDGVRSPDYFFNEKCICQLGLDLSETGRLNPAGKEKALSALRRFAALSRRMGVGEVIAIGTAALREAEDGPAFREEIEAETGLAVRVATGSEEAHLAAQGVMLGWPNVDGVVADLGGSSLELARVRGGRIEAAVSSPSGHLRLAEQNAPSARQAMMALAAAAGPFAMDGGRLVLVGGAWRALAKAHMAMENYPLHVLQGYAIDAPDALKLCDWATTAKPSEVKKASDVSNSRLASVAAGAHALKRLLLDIRPDEVSISAFGVREGLIYERLSPSLRAVEPLTAAADGAERRNARCPGFGAELFAWMRPLLGGLTDDQMRLAEATCLLHDANWRTHPDYRAAACFNLVTRANLGGVGHKDRLFMGAALLHRYKGSGNDREASDAIARLPEDARKGAEIVGRAARLGAMLSGSAIGALGLCRLTVEGDRLRLTFADEASEFAGERVERRFRALADAMSLEPVYEV